MESGSRSPEPKAIVHRQILDRASENPDESIDGLAEAVPGATPDLVEQVLDTYGDPGESTDDESSGDESRPDVSAEPESGTDTPPESQDGATPMPTPNTPPRPEALSDEQLAIIEAIDRRPDATQSEIADELDVSTATVNKRVNAIEGFEWGERAEFVEAVLEPAETASDGGQATDGSVTALRERVDRLEDRIDDRGSGNGETGAFDDPELAAKVVRACVTSDSITEDEEVRIIQRLLGGT